MTTGTVGRDLEISVRILESGAWRSDTLLVEAI
jgi:hypothetical protein